MMVVVDLIEDVIVPKMTANRAIDQAALPYLASLRDELRRQGSE